MLRYERFKTREVGIGTLPLGGDNPIRIQSMTTTDTMDTEGTIAQSIRMIEAGSEYVRITAPSKKEAQNLEEIKKGLRAAGFNTPLIADIHFTPNAAELAARIVEKVRVNPGNYADKKKFNIIEYSDADYKAEIDRIRRKFTPLVKICKEYGTAMRIGTNHGSLSDRIMSRYGDTPLGMVESALEFVRICENEGYFDIVLSMKASNPKVMVQAYRLLVSKMMENGQNYPLHLGVTEAGDGEDGRIKSAVGIGSLLEDGLGDTVRVSLTEEPEAELPVARALVDRFTNYSHTPVATPIEVTTFNPYEYHKYPTVQLDNMGGDKPAVVVADLSGADVNDYDSYAQIGYSYNAALDKFNMADAAADYAYLGNHIPQISLPGGLIKVVDIQTWNALNDKAGYIPFAKAADIESLPEGSMAFLEVDVSEIIEQLILTIQQKPKAVVVLSSSEGLAPRHIRNAFMQFQKKGLKNPVIIKRSYSAKPNQALLLDSAVDLGSVLVDGFGNGLWLLAERTRLDTLNNLSFGILQSTRDRISKTEYISCPSCGRTLFDLQETTAMIREKTNHLKGVKIGIMGCIVNGPGEMADADYGYVGSGPGKITLYKGQEVVKRNIPTAQALDELIQLIKDDGSWVEPHQLQVQ